MVSLSGQLPKALIIVSFAFGGLVNFTQRCRLQTHKVTADVCLLPATFVDSVLGSSAIKCPH